MKGSFSIKKEIQYSLYGVRVTVDMYGERKVLVKKIMVSTWTRFGMTFRIIILCKRNVLPFSVVLQEKLQ